MIIFAKILPVILLTLLPIPSVTLRMNDTLAKWACQYYYKNENGNCTKVVQEMKANYYNTTGLPDISYINLGDPSNAPMVLLHGWPDSPVEWINQMEYFCLPPTGKFYCIAPAMPNYIPDLPEYPERELYHNVFIDRLFDLVTDLKLKNITWMIHDWGSFHGYHFAIKYPEVVSRIISFDIGYLCTNCTQNQNTTYQIMQASAWSQKSDAIALQGLGSWAAEVPCHEAITWRISWPYYRIQDNQFYTRIFNCPVEIVFQTNQWPKLPIVPMMFIWGNTTMGKPREADTLFFSSDWLSYVESTPYGEVFESGSSHWMLISDAQRVNIKINSWINRQMDTKPVRTNLLPVCPWTCDIGSYGKNDSCDCNCGFDDPDCKNGECVPIVPMCSICNYYMDSPVYGEICQDSMTCHATSNGECLNSLKCINNKPPTQAPIPKCPQDVPLDSTECLLNNTECQYDPTDCCGVRDKATTIASCTFSEKLGQTTVYHWKIRKEECGVCPDTDDSAGMRINVTTMFNMGILFLLTFI